MTLVTTESSNKTLMSIEGCSNLEDLVVGCGGWMRLSNDEQLRVNNPPSRLSEQALPQNSRDKEAKQQNL